MAELDPNAQRIINELPDAMEALRDADAGLAATSTTLRDVAEREARLGEEESADAAKLRFDHSMRVFQGYEPRLREIIRHVFAGEESQLTAIPPLEECQRIAELDERVATAAGQPVVVLKPGKNWIDIGTLETARDSEIAHNTGLQLSYDRGKTSIVLPVFNSVTISLNTGDKPAWEEEREDEELRERSRLILGESPRARPVVDPLHTVLLPLPDGTPESSQAETAYVLIGYTFLQQTLNRIYGFDFDKVKNEESGLTAYRKFFAVTQLQQRLEQAGVAFDIDFIDGCLEYRIDKLEQEMQKNGVQQGTSLYYQQTVLNGLKQKRADLTRAGWISPAADNGIKEP